MTLNHVLNWLCCCGAFEDLFLADARDVSDSESDLSRPLVLHQDNDLEEYSQASSSKDLLTKKLTNILGFGRQNVRGDYELLDVLGEGAFGVVKRCRNRTTGQDFACKIIEKKQLRKRADVEDIRREVQILMLLSSHPSVAALVASYEDASAVYLILELCEGGQIFDRLISMGTINEQCVSHIFKQMVQLVDQCHTLGIAHRDVKPENFLLSSDKEDATIKAADFGLSQFFVSGKPFKSLIGSAYYVAPEVLNRSYGPKADMWSLGVCLYVMLSGSPPFEGDGEGEIFDNILYREPDLSSNPWPSVSTHAKALVRTLLQKNPERRPDPKSVLRHRWLCELAPHKPLPPVVLERMAQFSGNTRVKHDTLVAATIALEAGATHEMLDMVLSVSKPPSSVEDVGDMMEAFNVTVSDKVKRTLFSFSRTVCQKEDTKSVVIGMSEARRDEFYLRRAALPKIQTGSP
jgi:calcium-dependent protein kinase